MMLLIFLITTISPISALAFDISEEDKLGNNKFIVTGDELLETTNALKSKDATIEELKKEKSLLKKENDKLDGIITDLKIELNLVREKNGLLKNRIDYYKGSLNQNEKAYTIALEEANKIIKNKDKIIELEKEKKDFTITNKLQTVALGFVAGILFNEFK